MKLAVLRHSTDDARIIQLVWGILFGLIAIITTYAASRAQYAIPGLGSDVLATLFGLWTLGWAFGPTLFGGEDKTLLPEHFRSLPISAKRLATGLLGASFVSVPAVIGLLGFGTLVSYAWQFGLVPVFVAIPAAILQLGLAVILCRTVTSALRAFTQSQLCLIISSAFTAAMASFFVTGWALFLTLDQVFANGFPHAISSVLHVLPSSWGIVAIEAADKGNWGVVAAALAGFGLLIALLVIVWSRLLVRRLTTKAVQRPVVYRKSKTSTFLSSSPTGAVVRRELITWRRDFTRGNFIYFAFFFSLFLCLYPLAAGSDFLLLLVGVLFVITAIGSTANLYGSDGSALWMTMLAPGASIHDVRGRQLAWLLIVAPPAIIASIAGLIYTGYGWAVPGAITSLIAALGAGSGLVVLNSVIRMIPMTDPYKRGEDLLEHNVSWWQFMSLMLLTLVLLAPSLTLVGFGMHLNNNALSWLGVPAAIITGAIYYWGFGALAARRLESQSPELLSLMLRGPSSTTDTNAAKPSLNALTKTMTWQTQTAVYGTMTLGLLALLPQGVVPLLIKLTGGHDKIWFLALYLPNVWQWPVIAGMILLGLVLLTLALLAFLRHRTATFRSIASKK